MPTVVVAEKPSMARDIAQVLGARQRGNGYLQGNGYIVTWAVGHLVGLAQPHEIDPNWKRWAIELLPMLPKTWTLSLNPKTADQFQIVSRLLNDSANQQLICATDAGREGELIFRYIHQQSDCDKPFQRLWISSLTPEAIRNGFDNLKPGSAFDALGDAARGRSQADWLVGLNLSRACTLAFSAQGGDVLSVGRVQTPTLAMLVKREEEINNFVPEEFLLLKADFKNPREETYNATWFNGKKPTPESKRLPIDGKQAKQILARIQQGQATISELKVEPRSLPAPQFYDLTELQRHANRLYSFSADKTLKLAQELYEHKLISYPRTDSRYLSNDVAQTLPEIIATVRAPYEAHLDQQTGSTPLGKRFIDNGKINDHHAIIPTNRRSALNSESDTGKLYDLICRRLLMAWQANHRYSQSTLITTVHSNNDGKIVEDHFHASGQQILQHGWKALEVQTRNNSDEPKPLPPLEKGESVVLLKAESQKSQTRPPPRLSDAALLTAMESAGRSLDDKELSAAMRENGLGTPATRAEIIETLLRRGYLSRKKKQLQPTLKGMQLIQQVPTALKTPELTGQWEAYLQKIQSGEASLSEFMAGIETYVREAVTEVFSIQSSANHTCGIEPSTNPAKSRSVSITEPIPIQELPQLLQRTFGLPSFRPFQQEVCETVCGGEDLLLVMPTGAGKSLCYQLPGLALGGTTLVISPLIALMDDQVSKLQALGLKAERIHSGLSREQSREICREYLRGHLDYLFIAPERLSVPGFGNMLAKRKPVLIAVDEAHCISQWGHDFRPDYRLLHRHLPKLEPAPIIALTATATPEVQRDICQQLGKPEAKQFIHGFRRHNIAIEVNELAPGERPDAVEQLLGDESLRPAIVYASSRKEANLLAEQLSRQFACAAYHAGMPATERDSVQRRFLGSELEVIVATIAFGMGVDKADIRCVIHTALPSSVESYYQEIGRAGRDGQPSHALLLYSYADRRTHDYFFQRDYPELELLEEVYSQLGAQEQSKEQLCHRLKLEPELLDRRLERLWVQGAAKVTPDETVSRGETSAWQDLYLQQRQHKQVQLEKMFHYAQGQSCRMLALIHHFGDETDSQKPCGLCDICQPEQHLLHEELAPATKQQQHVIECLILGLRQQNGQSSGRLHQQFGEGLERRDFERLISALRRATLLDLQEDSFEKGGKQIRFTRVYLTGESRSGQLDYAAIELPQFGKKAKKRRAAPKREVLTRDSLSASANSLLQRLTQWRLSAARKEKVPAFRICSDKTLLELAAHPPQDEAGLYEISGIGAKKVEQYGQDILRLTAG